LSVNLTFPHPSIPNPPHIIVFNVLRFAFQTRNPKPETFPHPSIPKGPTAHYYIQRFAFCISTRNPKPETRNLPPPHIIVFNILHFAFQPETRNPKPETFPHPSIPKGPTAHYCIQRFAFCLSNQKPGTRNPKPETRNPKPETNPLLYPK
jgi:hypothetical protein